MIESDDDPRLTGDHVRSVCDDERRVTLVGVVHDHPASVYRVRETVRRRDPAVLALELPPMAVPLFTHYARDSRCPPAFGGEMSAAIQAATTDRVVGIDGPSRPFVRQLAGTLVRERAGPATVREVAEALGVAVRSAVVSRVAATVAGVTSIRLEVGQPWTYAVDRSDAPAAQASDERVHLKRAMALSSSLIPPEAKRLRDEVRETYMADRVATIDTDGDVVVILGRDHLDPVVDSLTAR